MRVADAMSREVLVVGTGHTLAEVARLMTGRNIGAAVVLEDGMPGPGIVTERDILRAVARGLDPQTATVSEAMTFEARTASSSWDLDTAAREMITGNFRHLVVVDDGGQLAGIVSMRDVVRARLGAEVAAPPA